MKISSGSKLLIFYSLIIISLVSQPSYISGQTGYYNIKDYGAVADGVTLNSEAIQKAINACAVNGGTVLIPPGVYLTGSLDLKSNVDIYLQRGATLLGSTNIKDYNERVPALRSYNDIFLKHSIFYAERVENISIRGEGLIDGQGSAYIITTKKKPDRYRNRPYVIRFVECKNVRVEGITMQNSAMWMQQYLACEDVVIRGIKVYNHANKNNDMMDIDGCKNVIISDCFGDTDDDAITLKSTSPRITENVTITNCVVSSHCNAIKMGTESIGGFKNIAISNIVVKPSSSPTKIYGLHGGISGITLGLVDGCVMDGITISNIRIDGPVVPIYMRLGNRARKYAGDVPTPGVGTYRNISISDVVVANAGVIGCSLTGIPNHPIENISLNNISIIFPGGGTKEDAMKQLEELEDHYPESTKWGPLPSYGFYIRHAENVTLNNINIQFENEDARPALICDDVKGLNIYGLQAECSEDASSLIKFTNVRDAAIYNSSSKTPTNYFIDVTGTESSNIKLISNDLTNIKEVCTERSNEMIRQIGNLK